MFHACFVNYNTHLWNLLLGQVASQCAWFSNTGRMGGNKRHSAEDSKTFQLGLWHSRGRCQGFAPHELVIKKSRLEETPETPDYSWRVSNAKALMSDRIPRSASLLKEAFWVFSLGISGVLACKTTLCWAECRALVVTVARLGEASGGNINGPLLSGTTLSSLSMWLCTCSGIVYQSVLLCVSLQQSTCYMDSSSIQWAM